MNTTLRNHLEYQQLPQKVIDEIVEMYAWEASIILSKFEHLDPTIRDTVAHAIHSYNVAMSWNKLEFAWHGTILADGFITNVQWNRWNASNHGTAQEYA